MLSLMRPLSASPTRSTSTGVFRCLRVRLLTQAGMVAENSIVCRVAGTPCRPRPRAHYTLYSSRWTHCLCMIRRQRVRGNMPLEKTIIVAIKHTRTHRSPQTASTQ